MRTSNILFRKAALVLLLAGVVGATAAFAQTFTQPSGSLMTGNIPAPLNSGATAQTLTGGFWASGVAAATAFNMNWSASTWANESNVTTLRVQQVCVNGTCKASPPAAVPAHADIPLTNTSCGGGAQGTGSCNPDAYTAARVCMDHGYSHAVSLVPNGNGGRVCTWVTTDQSWHCDTSCSTSCDSKTMTQISCDNNGTSRLQ